MGAVYILAHSQRKQQGRGKIEEKIGARTDWQRADMDTFSKVHNAEKPTR